MANWVPARKLSYRYALINDVIFTKVTLVIFKDEQQGYHTYCLTHHSRHFSYKIQGPWSQSCHNILSQRHKSSQFFYQQ